MCVSLLNYIVGAFYGIELFIAFVNSDGWGNNDVEYPVLLVY